jgi:hypothetical protein
MFLHERRPLSLPWSLVGRLLFIGGEPPRFQAVPFSGLI